MYNFKLKVQIVHRFKPILNIVFINNKYERQEYCCYKLKRKMKNEKNIRSINYRITNIIPIINI